MGFFKYLSDGIKFDAFYRRNRGLYRAMAGIDVPASKALPFENIDENLAKYETSMSLKEFIREQKLNRARAKAQEIIEVIENTEEEEE